MTWFLVAAAGPFAPGDREYLLEARQTQALSVAVHIPIVCFGIAFPAFDLLLEGLWLRTGDPLYPTIAKRWSKVMLALFATLRTPSRSRRASSSGARAVLGRGRSRVEQALLASR